MHGTALALIAGEGRLFGRICDTRDLESGIPACKKTMLAPAALCNSAGPLALRRVVHANYIRQPGQGDRA